MNRDNAPIQPPMTRFGAMSDTNVRFGIDDLAFDWLWQIRDDVFMNDCDCKSLINKLDISDHEHLYLSLSLCKLKLLIYKYCKYYSINNGEANIVTHKSDHTVSGSLLSMSNEISFSSKFSSFSGS